MSAKIDTVEIFRLKTPTDPPLEFFQVIVRYSEGVWCETFGSEELLKVFLKGLQVGCDASGVQLPRFEIPRESVPMPLLRYAHADDHADDIPF